MNEPT